MLKFLTFFGVFCVFAYTTMSATARYVSKDTKPIRNVNCWQGTPMIGLVPHPLNCYKFYSCVPSPSDYTAPTMPVEMDCQSGDHGPLFYDFRSCSCQYNNSVCFDGMVDQAEFFNCAKEYDPSEFVTEEPVTSSI